MNLILTFDYELFGDGSGDVFAHMIDPTYRILELCKKHNIKTTIFFEALEYIKLKEEWDKGNDMGYKSNPIQAIDQQILKAYRDGHDVQLHIHPQWYNSAYSNNTWNLDLSNWRLGDFNEKNCSLQDLIEKCKLELENIIKPSFPNYQCIGLRAGGYNIMPSENVYNSMINLGFKFDSSIYPGGYEEGALSKYDYRNVDINKDFWWASNKDLRIEDNARGEIIEIPVFALPISRWKRFFTREKIKSIILRHNNAISSNSKEKMNSISTKGKFKYFIQKESFTWDVCVFSKSLHKMFFSYIENKLIDKRKSFVLIGHPKSLRDIKLFENFVSIAMKRNHDYKFITLSEYYESIV